MPAYGTRMRAPFTRAHRIINKAGKLTAKNDPCDVKITGINCDGILELLKI